jgi:SAM-dependent methyltransferase
MSTHEKKTFYATYDWAKTWHDLPWAHDEPTLFLAEICRQREPGRALDIGCGAGTDSVFLASQGWDVTSLDFMPRALEYTQQRAREAGVKVTPVEADITEWVVPGSYDLVLDHGLLHNMDPLRYPAYRERVLKAVGDEADFVLLHWHPRYAGQANGKMGPTRVDREDIKNFFAPELQERFFAREEFEDLPDMVGGGMSQAYYWFRRNQAQLKPAALLQQIRATLQRHSYDYEALLGKDGDKPLNAELAPELMAKVLGPGRLGITHRVPEPAAVAGILSTWARHAGVSARQAENLLTVFASDRHGKICVAASPRCDQCDVTFCKRLRYR